MKKIFGMLSLIAILTVAFTTQANSMDTDTEATCFVQDIGSDGIDYIAPSVETASVAISPTALQPISCPVEADAFAYSVPIKFSSDTSPDISCSLKTDKYKLSNFDEPIPDAGTIDTSTNDKCSSDSTSEPTFKNGYECPDFTADISTNVGKLTSKIS